MARRPARGPRLPGRRPSRERTLAEGQGGVTRPGPGADALFRGVRDLCRARSGVYLAALLADIGAIDRDALRDVLVGEAETPKRDKSRTKRPTEELRAKVDATLSRLPEEFAEEVAEIRAVYDGTVASTAKAPKIERLRSRVLEFTRVETDELPSGVVTLVEDFRENAALLASDLAAFNPRAVPAGERLRSAVTALRRKAEAAGAPSSVVPAGCV